MGGLNYGNKYTFTKAVKKLKSNGVLFSKITNKWLVVVNNTTKSKHVKPFVVKAQFNTEKEANKYYKFLLKQ